MGGRCALLCGAPRQNAGNIHGAALVGAAHVNGLQHPVKQNAGRPDERLAFAVLVTVGGFGDDHDPRACDAIGKHQIAGTRLEVAMRKCFHRGAQTLQILRCGGRLACQCRRIDLLGNRRLSGGRGRSVGRFCHLFRGFVVQIVAVDGCVLNGLIRAHLDLPVKKRFRCPVFCCRFHAAQSSLPRPQAKADFMPSHTPAPLAAPAPWPYKRCSQKGAHMTFRAQHLLGIEHLHPVEITTLLDLADHYAEHNRQGRTHRDVLEGMMQINMFFENSTRTQASFEIAGKRLGADVMNMGMQASSIKKGETLIDTALTLNAMRPDLLVVRHPNSGAVDLLAQKVNCAVLNAGDGRHEHPTQALLDALTIRRAKGRLHRLSIAICGDIAHSRVARSNILLLGKMENRLRLIGPPTLLPSGVEEFGVEVFHDMREGLRDVDVVMMLRLQKERMDGGFIPSEREYFHRYGLDAEKLAYAKDDAIVMHPGPMNRGVEIDGTIADDINRSVIQEQVEMGVAVRMAAMDLLARNLRAKRGAQAAGIMA